MNVTRLVLAAGWRDLARSRWLIAYALGFFLLAEGLFWFGGTGPQVLLSLLNATLLVVPLAALVFGTMHVYSSREFVELLLAQPVARRPLFTGLFLGLALPVAGAFLAGCGLPFLLHRGGGATPGALFTFFAAGVVLSMVFAAIAAWIAWSTDDRLRGVGIALAVWLGVTILYDGAVLAAVAAFADVPLEKPLIGAMLLNPVDLARLVVIGQLDASALMGYTGAVFNQALGSTTGTLVAAFALVTWCAVPLLMANVRFNKRDF